MRRALLAALLFASGAAARAAPPPTALVWIPAEDFSHWSAVDDALRRRSDLKLTIALTPAMVTPIVKDFLAPWTSTGRVEVAARVSGDPVLPLVAAHPAAPRPDDALERGAEARSLVEKRLGASGVGLIVGGGALDPTLVGPVAAVGAPWAVVGPYVEGSSWAVAGRTLFVPAHGAPRGALIPEDATAPGAWVFDETSGESALVAALAALRWRDKPASGWTTVSQFCAASAGPRADAAAVAAWPGWDGAPAAPDPTARAAWDAYGEAAKALAQYQNSGSADLAVLETATALLRRAQDGRFYRAPAAGAATSAAPGVPPDLRARLLALYRRLRLAAPETLYAVGASTTAATASDDRPTGVHQGSGPGWVAFDNPAGTLALAPPGVDPEPWRLHGLRVEWDDSRVLLRLFVGRVDVPEGAPRPVFDVYIDQNHILGAGSIRLLEGRACFAAARDAWEYALTTAGSDARLWRATASGDPDLIATLETTTDAAAKEIRIAVPRALLRGNPGRWGYIPLALAEDPRRPGRIPPAPLVGADGAVVRGLIAPIEIQKALFDHPGSPQRVPAVRVETGP